MFFNSIKIKRQKHKRNETTLCLLLGVALKTGGDYSNQAPLHTGMADYGGTANLETKSEYSNRATEVPRSTKATVGHLGNVGDEGWSLPLSLFLFIILTQAHFLRHLFSSASRVNCGGHRAASCAECPEDKGFEKQDQPEEQKKV